MSTLATNDLHEVDTMPTAVGTMDTTTGFILLTVAAGAVGGTWGIWTAIMAAVAMTGAGLLWHGTMRRLEWRELLCSSVLARAAGADLNGDELEPFDPEGLTRPDDSSPAGDVIR